MGMIITYAAVINALRVSTDEENGGHLRAAAAGDERYDWQVPRLRMCPPFS